MIVDTIRMVTDALSGSYGVNTKLVSLPMDSGSSAVPTLKAVVDETRSEEVAVGRFPSTYPLLSVTLEGNPTLVGDVVSGTRDGEVSVVIRYVTKDVDSAQSVTDSFQTLRAVTRTLKEFNSNTRASDRQRNDVHIVECLRMEVVPTMTNIEDAFNTGAVKATFRVRDIEP